jgi:hypothetical protein
MKKSIQKFGGFEIVLMSVSRIGDTGSRGQRSHFPANDRNNVIVFIDGQGWLRRETNRVGVFVLSPGSEEWGSHLGDSQRFLEELRACVRILLKDWDEKSDIEVKNMTYTWASA